MFADKVWDNVSIDSTFLFKSISVRKQQENIYIKQKRMKKGVNQKVNRSYKTAVSMPGPQLHNGHRTHQPCPEAWTLWSQDKVWQ